MEIGILAYQGGIDEHKYMVLETCKEMNIQCNVRNVVKPRDLNNLDALILPGGESTTITKFMNRYGIVDELREKIRSGIPTLGTCAGAIILAKNVRDLKTGKTLSGVLGVLDATVIRNYYGRQRESFEIDLKIPVLGDKPFRAVFIRAPAITEIGPSVEPLATLENVYVFVKQGNILATTFHPELSGDTRIHRFLLQMAKK